MVPSTQTGSTTLRDDDGDGGITEPVPALIVAMHCEDLAARPRVVMLGEVGTVELGRGAAWGTTARGSTALSVSLPDGRVSTRHARLERLVDGWYVADLSSKNGTQVNARPVERCRLGDGDVLQLGGTVLVYRERGAGRADGAAATLPALRTMHAPLARALATLKTMAPSTVPVLLRGDVGTGKELAARAVHALSGRTGAFVAINCGALPTTLIESELFGTRRGAFSGAEDRPGLIRAAQGGTVFLDEIAELPMASQAALLRVLQEHEVMPLGESRPQRVDVRFVAATHQDLYARVAQGLFRHDLLSRIAGFELRIPRLCERREDLGMIVHALLAERTPPRRLSRAAARALFAYEWPDNVRELSHSLALAASAAGDAPTIELAHLPQRVRDSVVDASAGPARPRNVPEPACPYPRERLERLLLQHQGNVSAVARALREHRTQLRRWLERHGLDPAAFRAAPSDD